MTACDRISSFIAEFDFVLILLHFLGLSDRIDRIDRFYSI